MVDQARNYPYPAPKKQIVILTAGFMSLGLGVMGFILPILQGFLLIGFGLWLLPKESMAIKGLSNRLKSRYPRQHKCLLSWRSRLLTLLTNEAPKPL
jgi:uncharacterized membrane protein YbaN (DUF454 family)